MPSFRAANLYRPFRYDITAYGLLTIAAILLCGKLQLREDYLRTPKITECFSKLSRLNIFFFKFFFGCKYYRFSAL